MKCVYGDVCGEMEIFFVMCVGMNENMVCVVVWEYSVWLRLQENEVCS